MIQAEVIIRGDLLRTLGSGDKDKGEKGGNPVAVAIGRYCFFSKGCELRPPGKMYKGFVFFLLLLLLHLFYSPRCLLFFGERFGILTASKIRRTFSHYPLKIGDHVFIGPSSIIEAALIGNHVSIGSNVVVGRFAILRDYVRVLDGAVIPPNMVVPSFSVVGGRPGRVVGEVREGEVEGFDLRERYRGVGNS